MDFRSDTVTQPSEAMRQCMAHAKVGDDVYGDDPTVNDLEHWAAARHGFESALFVTSGTQANLLALMAHCDRGDEYLCGQQAHNYRYEAGGAAVLGSIQPQPIENNPDGSLDFDKLAAAVKPADFHFARTRLLSLENTINGKVLSLEYLQQARQFADRHHLKLHLDGARIYNAAAALDLDIAELVAPFDSITICLSKGLGAPVGSLLLGDRQYIEKARRIRKMLGGGMRQAGILAAAGKMVLQDPIPQLRMDHQNAQYLASELNKIHGWSVNTQFVQTNIVFAKCPDELDGQALSAYLMEKGILVTPGIPMRFVTHNGITETAIDQMIAGIKQYQAM
jgi:threonine aldolase